MSKSMPHIPTYVGTPSFHRNLALQALEQNALARARPSEVPVEATKEVVVELTINRDAEEQVSPPTDLSLFAREYLTKRHETFHLDPLPLACDEDPYNWPTEKKIGVLLLHAFHCMVATLSMTSLIPAYSQLAKELDMTEHDCTCLTLVQVLILGVAPLIWGPIATVYGRRPVHLVSLLMSVIGNVACGASPNYGSIMFFRAFVAFFLSPAGTLSSAVVTDMFFITERARGVSICTLMFSLGSPLGPFIFGFVIPRAGFRWVFWVLAIVNGLQLITHLLFGSETLFIRSLNRAPDGALEGTSKGLKAKLFTFERVGSKRISKVDFLHPLAMAACPRAILPALAQSVVFLFGSIFTVVEIPLQLEERFNLSTDQVSLQFVGMLVGSILAEPVGGLLSDFAMNQRRAMRDGEVSPAEFRLWLSYGGYFLILFGIPLFLVSTDNAEWGKLTVVPVVGTAIAAAGSQIAITTLATYAADCLIDDAVSVGVLTSFLRHIIAFIGPLWFPAMIRSEGLSWSSSIAYSIIILFGVFPTVFLHVNGRHWR